MRSFLFSILAITIIYAMTGSWSFYGDINYGRCSVYHDGYIWIGTKGGIVRLEPITGDYIHYSHIDGLGGLEIISLAVDDEGFLWYASSNGFIGAYINGSFKSAVELAQDFITINSMTFYRGNLWIATSKGLVRATPVPTTFSVAQFNDFYEYFGNLPFQTAVEDIAFLRDSIFIATQYGIAYAHIDSNLFIPSTWDTAGIWLTTVDTSETTYNLRGAVAIEVHRETLWALAKTNAGEKTLFSFYDGKFFNRAPSFSDNLAWDLLSVDDTLWSMGNRGLYYYSPATNTMRRMPRDRANLWGTFSIVDIGTMKIVSTRYGYSIMANDSLHLTLFNAPIGTDIADINFSKNGDVVMTSHYEGVNIFDGQNWKQFDYYILLDHIADSIRNKVLRVFINAWSSVLADDGVLWVGSYGRGLCKVFPDSTCEVWDATNSSFVSSVEDDTNYVVVSRLNVDPMGNVWAGCYCSIDDAPLKVWTPDRFNNPNGAISFDTRHGVPSRLLMDFDCSWDMVAVATMDGASVIYHAGTIEDRSDDKYYSLRGLLPSDDVYAVAIDKNGRIWFGTAAGLAYYDIGGLVVNLELPIDLSITVTSLATDSLGNIWIATLNGAAVYMPDGYFATFKSIFSEEAPFADRTPLLSDVIGVISPTPLGGVFTDGKSGDIWFGFSGGSVVLHSPYKSSDVVEPIRIYPNPAIRKRGITPTVYVSNVPADASLMIYNSAGELIREIPHYMKAHDGVFRWDCKNSDGNYVAPGVYLFAAPSKNGIPKGKAFVMP